MTDLAVQILKPTADSTPSPAKILTRTPGRTPPVGGEIGDRVRACRRRLWTRIQRLERWRDPAPGSPGRSEQDRARHFGVRLGFESQPIIEAP